MGCSNSSRISEKKEDTNQNNRDSNNDQPDNEKLICEKYHLDWEELHNEKEFPEMLSLLKENEKIAKEKYNGNSDLAYINNEECRNNITKYLQLRNQMFDRYKINDGSKEKNVYSNFDSLDVFYNILKLYPSMLDSSKDDSSFSNIKSFSGPNGNRMPFYKPQNCYGFGINIKNKTWDPTKDLNIFSEDNNKDEWWICYFGLENPNMIKDILENGFITEKLSNPQGEDQWAQILNENEIQKNPYFTPFPEYAEFFAERRGGLNYKGESYIFLLLCRINPSAPKELGDQNNWNLTNENNNIIKPFSILVKKNECKYKLSDFKEKIEHYKNIHINMDQLSWNNPEKNLSKA